MSNIHLRLPAKHTRDWLDRGGRDMGAVVVREQTHVVDVELPQEALTDLIADAQHYADEMHGENTDGIDYRPAARRVLAAIVKQMAS